MYCPECGHHNRESARFCGRCGASLPAPDAGEQTMTFETLAEEAAEGDGGEAVGDGAVLIIRAGGGRAGEQFAVDRERMAIGRAPQSDVFLDDITVSREHAVLERRGDGLHLIDRGSLNGTYVNRERVDSVRLADGDELQIGKYRLAYIERGV